MKSQGQPSDRIEPRASGGSSRSSDFELYVAFFRACRHACEVTMYTYDSSDDNRSDTFSVDSSITKYRVENGRSYHAYKEGTYWAPNDEKQNENLDISHHKFFLILEGQLFLAPLEKTIKNALDIGTGTGIWAIDFADEFPETDIYGTDLSAIQPSMVPPNCRFEIDDARDPWVYPPDFFDYIHIRSLFGSIEDWPALYSQAFKHTKPGGWIEQLELSIDITADDGTLTPDNPLVKFVELFKEAGELTGQTFQIFDTMSQQIQDAGFINLTERRYKIPLGGWPADPHLREIGQWNLLSFDVGLEGYALATLTRVLGWNRNEVHVFLAQLRKAARDRGTHSYHEVKVVYAQKPESAGNEEELVAAGTTS